MYKEWGEVEARYWAMWLLALEMVLMMTALRRAFPVREIEKIIPEIHHEFLDMVMQSDVQKEQSRRVNSEIESEDDDETGDSESD
mmetsp:Transcript_54527/g.126957  ORF Transcript_54527/g.126957 Transcript_54527/m.126957 type:complete len:85 (+) Transcript_54527:380-634(+)